MTVVVILPHGTQIGMTVNDVDRWLADRDLERVERGKRTDLQHAYRIVWRDGFSFTAVCNAHSEATELLAARAAGTR